MRLKLYSPKKNIFILTLSFSLLGIFGFSLMKKWEYFQTPHLHTLNDLWCDGEVVVGAGYYQSLEDLLIRDLYESLSKQEAIILYKKDKRSDWKKVYSGRGDVLQLSYNSEEKYLYALGREYFPDGQWKAFLLFSRDLGKTWKELPGLPGRIEGIAFGSTKVAYVWSKEQIYRSIDEAQTWAPYSEFAFLLKLDRPTPISGTDGIFWYANKSELFSILPDGQVQQEKLPEGLVPTILTTDRSNKLWILAKSEADGKLLLLKRVAAGDFDNVSSLSYFLPEQLYIGDRTSVIVGSDLSNLPPPVDVMVQSKDGGKSWAPIPKAPDGTKVFFEGNKAIWRIGTMDRLQRWEN